MKKCAICHKEKPKTEFNKHAGRKDGLQTHCRECNKARSKNYYKRNPIKHKENVAKRSKVVREELREKIWDYLERHPCVDCGEVDPVVLEFDHKRDKVAAVSSLVAKESWALIEEEIQKCEVRCANCHRRKTAKERNYYFKPL